MLKAEAISFRYDNGPWLLTEFDFEVRPGEVVGLPGPSGQGKSTLAKLLSGYLRPGQGKITCDGKPLPKGAFNPVQLIFQHPELTMNPRWKLGDSLSEGYEVGEDALNSLNIERNWLNRYPHELSGGELQRLALARVMSSKTRYLLADEMTAMLDPNTQALIWDRVLTWAKSLNIGVLAISHDHSLLERVADRIDYTFTPQAPEVRTEAELSSAA